MRELLIDYLRGRCRSFWNLESAVPVSDGIGRTKTMALIPVLTSLVQPGHVKSWLRPHIIQALALLPLRPQGVRNTIEFIFSVHPSNVQNMTPAATPESRGASISMEALSSASKLISSPPSNMSADTWFSGIAPQLLSLLDGEGGLELIKAASFIIGYGVLGRRQLGAPGICYQSESYFYTLIIRS